MNEVIEAESKEVLQVQPTQQSLNPMSLLTTAIENNLDIEKLEKLMILQERWEKKEAEKAFDHAFALAQGEFKPIKKDKDVYYKSERTNKITAYKFASFDSISEATKPALSKHGFSISFHQSQENGKVITTAVLKHEKGGARRTSLESPPDSSGGKNGIQALGSTDSYLKRYTLTALLGVSFSEDDDGQAAGNQASQEIKKNYSKQDLIDWCINNNRKEAPTVNWLAQKGLCREGLGSFDQFNHDDINKSMIHLSRLNK